MTDIFREVEEDVRRERLEKLWKSYGDFIIAALVLLILAVGGYEYWQVRQNAAQAKAADAFATAQALNSANQAASSFGDLSKIAPGGYSLLAQLAQANALFAQGQRDDAVAIYKDIAAKDAVSVGPTARLRAGWAMADGGDRAALATWLQPLTDPASAWHQMAEEVLAYADYRAGDLKKAQAEYGDIAADPASPDALRARARAMIAFLAEGGVHDVGTVPPPVAVQPGSALPQPAQ